jgi:type I restriction enzyme R subunit
LTSPESAARETIDRQLEAAGWTVAAPGSAIEGRPTALRELSGDTGRADYVLYLDGKACGILEAKRSDHSLQGVQEQSATYAAFRKWHDPATCWQSPLPFRFEANGRQIQFTDARDPQPRARNIFHFPTPDHLRDTLARAESGQDTLRRRLAKLPQTSPLDRFLASAAKPLRDCQTEAITHLEASLARGDPRALVHMATGAGKTFTAITQAYRLIKFAKLRRVLFLVDRKSLGTQAEGEFKDYQPPDDGRLFSQIYNLQNLGTSGYDPVNQVVISTIQRLFAQLKGDPEALDDEDDETSGFDAELATGPPVEVGYQPHLPPESFDLIIVDECHRSIYHKWKQVLDYFDAFLVGLTATPSVDTVAFFRQNVVSRYPYEQSVVDGVNVDYQAYRLRTRISEDGATLEAGSRLELFDRYRNQSESHAIGDDLDYTATELGRSVIAEDQIRKVLATYRDHLFTTFFPGRSGDWVPKTLVFAKTDHHADHIVRLVLDVFGKGDAFCKKITYKATSSAVPSKTLIGNFRNSPEWRIAVTVDMVATGTDIKPLECLIFLRDVRSELLYTQMKGRGCRTIDPNDLANVTPDAPGGQKTHFVLIDAVGVEESEKLAVSPADRRQTITLKDLIDGIVSGERGDPEDFASLARRLRRLAERARPEEIAPIERELGRPLPDWANEIAECGRADRPGPPASPPRQETLAPLAIDSLREKILALRGYSPVLIDILSQDTAEAPEAITPRRTIESFEQFLAENRDRLLALQILYHQSAGPGALTYEVIRELRDTLAQPPYHLAPEAVWQAYAALEKTTPATPPSKVLTNLITLVRHTVDPEKAPLAPFPELVEQRYQQWLDQRSDRFTDAQRHWLDTIKNYIALNGAFSTENPEAYRDAWEGVDSRQANALAVARKAFGEDLKPVIEELNEVLVA